MTKDQWIYRVIDLLGFRPTEDSIKENNLDLKEVYAHIGVPLGNDATDLAIEQRGRVLIFLLMSTFLFPNKSGSRRNMRYLLTISNGILGNDQPSWASGVHAHLYRHMCTSSLADSKDMSGCCLLIQLWAWERILCLRPENRGPILHDILADERAHGSRWNTGRSFRNAPKSQLTVFRDQLDMLTDAQGFMWRPYTDWVIAEKAARDDDFQVTCRARTPLVC